MILMNCKAWMDGSDDDAKNKLGKGNRGRKCFTPATDLKKGTIIGAWNDLSKQYCFQKCSYRVIKRHGGDYYFLHNDK